MIQKKKKNRTNTAYLMLYRRPINQEGKAIILTINTFADYWLNYFSLKIKFQSAKAEKWNVEVFLCSWQRKADRGYTGNTIPLWQLLFF